MCLKFEDLGFMMSSESVHSGAPKFFEEILCQKNDLEMCLPNME